MNQQWPTTEAGRRLAYEIGVQYRINLIASAEREAVMTAMGEVMGKLCACGRGGMHEPAVHDWADVNEELLRSLIHDLRESLDGCDHAMWSIHRDDRAGYERTCLLDARYLIDGMAAGRASSTSAG